MEREAILGATGRSSTVAIYPTLLNHVVGTKFKLVMGYKGSAGSHAGDGARRGRRALDHLGRREIARRAPPARQDHQHPGAIRPASGIPSCRTFRPRSSSGARPSRSRRCACSPMRPTSAASSCPTPDTPADRIQALRRAFDAMVKDPEFIADLKHAEARAWPADRRGAAEARGGGRQCLAGDDRAGQGHLFR